jgi:hypothetical protein
MYEILSFTATQMKLEDNMLNNVITYI